eukprot:2891982-Pyramimonas_sp.AAC.1
MLCRVWSLAREPHAKAWTMETSPSWDAAIIGNSALGEAFVRALDCELAVKLGGTMGTSILDIKSFYDHIRRPKLLSAALRLNFPPTLLFLELQIGLAPRVLSQL